MLQLTCNNIQSLCSACRRWYATVPKVLQVSSSLLRSLSTRSITWSLAYENVSSYIKGENRRWQYYGDDICHNDANKWSTTVLLNGDNNVTNSSSGNSFLEVYKIDFYIIILFSSPVIVVPEHIYWVHGIYDVLVQAALRSRETIRRKQLHVEDGVHHWVVASNRATQLPILCWRNIASKDIIRNIQKNSKNIIWICWLCTIKC